MGLYVVNLKEGASVYVLADNKNNAIYKAYNKAVIRIETIPGNEGFEKWKKGIEDVNMLYAMEIDSTRFNVY